MSSFSHCADVVRALDRDRYLATLFAPAERDTQNAAAALGESLALERAIGSKPGIARSLAGLAGVAGARGQPQRAARLFGTVAALLETIGADLEPADRVDYHRNVVSARAMLNAEAFAAAWAAGRALTLEQAVIEALAPDVA